MTGRNTMEYEKLLNLGSELGRMLMHAGAEIYRVEESVTRLLTAYGVEPQVFAIPNTLIVSIDTPEGRPMTRMCRIGPHGTDIELIEFCNDLCRKLCAAPIPVEEALARLRELPKRRKVYSNRVVLLGYVLASAFFAAFFGGGVEDFLCAALTGGVVGCVVLYGQPLIGSNGFFRTVVCSAVAGAIPMLLTAAGLGRDQDTIIIGVLMVLVPGMALTNAMREIMAGDIISGVNRTAEVLLVGTAIALGVALPLMVGRLW